MKKLFLSIIVFIVLISLTSLNKTLPGFIIKANKYFKREYNIFRSNILVHSRLNRTLKSLVYTFKGKGRNVHLEMAGMKNPASFRRKFLFKRDRNFNLMDDIVRASLVFEDMETLEMFKLKLKQLYVIRAMNDNYRTPIPYKAFFFKFTDVLSEARNLFEVQLMLCCSYFIGKYTHNHYRIVRNIDHLIKHGDSNNMNLKIDTNILLNSYNPYSFFLIKTLQKNWEYHHLTGKEILIKEIQFLVEKQLQYAQKKKCLKKYAFFFTFMRQQYLKLKLSRFHVQQMEKFFHFIKTITTKIYTNSNELMNVKTVCDC